MWLFLSPSFALGMFLKISRFFTIKCTIFLRNTASVCRLLKHISADSSGMACYKDPSTDMVDQIKNFFMGISQPVLANVNIKYPETDVLPSAVAKATSANYYSGGEVSRFLLSKLI